MSSQLSALAISIQSAFISDVPASDLICSNLPSDGRRRSDALSLCGPIGKQARPFGIREVYSLQSLTRAHKLQSTRLPGTRQHLRYRYRCMFAFSQQTPPNPHSGDLEAEHVGSLHVSLFHSMYHAGGASWNMRLLPSSCAIKLSRTLRMEFVGTWPSQVLLRRLHGCVCYEWRLLS